MATHVAIAILAVSLVPAGAQVRFVELSRTEVPEGTTRVDRSQSGRLYVLSRSADFIGMYSDQSQTYELAGGHGWGVNALDGPEGLFVDALSVYAADRNNRRIIRYDLDLRPISSVGADGGSGSADRFEYPIAVAVNARGSMAVLDAGRRECVVFDGKGDPAFILGQDARSSRIFSEPVDLAVGPGDEWLLLDRKWFAVFDSQGSIITSGDIPEGDALAIDANQHWVVIGTKTALILVTSSGRRFDVPLRSVLMTSAHRDLLDVMVREKSLALLLGNELVEFEPEEFER